ncbi:MAG: nucleotidyltransferase domain-containing protein [Cyclobacteriaceae bacterium]
MKLSANDIELIKGVFLDKPVKRAFLFGSFIRGEADQDSDVDILVELDYSKHIGIGFVKIKNQLEEVLNKKVDLVSENSVSHHIRPFINQDKQLIYER